MRLAKRQKSIVFGCLLGDGYLQKTGKENARLRLEHSTKQKEYMEWKRKELWNLFPNAPTILFRIHPNNRTRYSYIRLQSYSSVYLGALRNKFYEERDTGRPARKIIPRDLKKHLTGLALAVWYMDDGYYDKRDRSLHIYCSRLLTKEQENILETLKNRFGITRAHFYCRPDRHSCVLSITGSDKERLINVMRPFIIESLRYKIPS